MIFAFLEDGTLVIHASAADAIRAYEGIDVESGTVRFYDEAGMSLAPRFITPNRSGKTLGLFRWVVSGAYELVPTQAASEDPFALALYETRSLEPNPWFDSLETLKSTLSARGVAVDFDAKGRA